MKIRTKIKFQNWWFGSDYKIFTWTPKIPKIIKNVQQMRTMLPIGFNDDSRVCTTSFRPGARLITRNGRSDRSSRNTYDKIWNSKLDLKVYEMYVQINLLIMSTLGFKFSRVNWAFRVNFWSRENFLFRQSSLKINRCFSILKKLG